MVQVKQMEKQRGEIPELIESSTIANGSSKLRCLSKTTTVRCLRSVLATIAALMIVSIPAVVAQQTPPQHSDGIIVRGAVRNADGKPVGNAVVRLEQESVPGAMERKTDEAGAFSFSVLSTGSYQLSAEKSGLRSRTTVVNALSSGDQQKVDLVLEDPGLVHSDSSTSIRTMTFADKPNFTIAGVTDWTAVGGHGSDSSLRTSEDLATKTLTLKSAGPEHSAAGVASDTGEANRHRLAGELDEKSGDSLAAVHEYEQAVHLDPSEQNYFEWGSELLLHRAVWQSQEIFQKGAELYPKSARMLTGLGAALFSGARYDEAALSLCRASDLNPADPEPYLFMAKIQIAAPNALACIEEKLAHFVRDQPANSLANYLYAMAILKRLQQQPDKQAMQQVESLLTKAVTIDPKCGEAYLQLGILSATQRNFKQATDFYMKAIEANPQLGEAHYRMGVAYNQMGEPLKAKQEFEMHDEIEKRQAQDIERQRRELKQFLIVLPGQGTHPPAQ
jgi:tetratricopeptide (TPR) repeat protein